MHSQRILVGRTYLRHQMLSLSPKIQGRLRLLLSILVLTILAWQLWQLGQKLNTEAFWSAVLQAQNAWIIALVVFLMPVNWLLESWRWSLLLKPFHKWPFGRVFRAVMAGVSVSAATPNRVGEIGGRLLNASKQEAAGVVSSSILGALCQWLVFLGCGLPALCWVAGPLLAVDWPWLPWLGLAIALGLILALITYGTTGLTHLLGWIGKRFKIDLSSTQVALASISRTLLLRATAVSALRFFTYLIQLYLLLGVFGIDLPFWYGLAGIAAIYLVQAGIPLPPGINLLTRAELGVLLWGQNPAVIAGSLAAFSSLFLVNVLLPALLTHWLLVKRE